MRRSSGLDELLPTYDFSQRHDRFTRASPARALVAVAEVTLGEMPLGRFLFMLRSGRVPARRGGLPADPRRPVVEQLVEFGFVRLADASDELVLGYVGQPWKPNGGTMLGLASDAEWRAFAEPGFAKAAVWFGTTPQAGGARLATETRVAATDAVARRRFGRYWRLIALGSGAVRRSWLRAAARRAEAA